MNLYPFKLESVLKDIIWGGYALSENFGKGEKGQKIAEAWTLTHRPDGINIIQNGEYKGLTLKDITDKFGFFALCGKDYSEFPLLIKLLDANDKLSVQIHPDDEYAHSHGYDAGKTEMWYVVDAKPGATLVYGMKENCSLSGEEIKKAAQDGTLEEHLNYVPVKAGDVIFVAAGTVHAIGSGIIIAEIQQNSNTTFRMYDYNRKDSNGNTRELHIDKAIEVLDVKKVDSKTAIIEDTENIRYETVCDCEFFKVDSLNLCQAKKSFDSSDMVCILCIDGCGKISANGNDYDFSKGDCYLIPANMGKYEISSESAKVLLSYSK